MKRRKKLRYGRIVTRQWYRDGVPIPGVTAARYTTTAADVGARISCRMPRPRMCRLGHISERPDLAAILFGL